MIKHPHIMRLGPAVGGIAIGVDGWSFWPVHEALNTWVELAPSPNAPDVLICSVHATSRSPVTGVPSSTLRELPVGMLKRALMAPSVRGAITVARSGTGLGNGLSPWSASPTQLDWLRSRMGSSPERTPPFDHSRRGTKHREGFFDEFLEAWGAAAAAHPDPSVVLSRRYNIPLSTTHSWVKRARTNWKAA